VDVNVALQHSVTCLVECSRRLTNERGLIHGGVKLVIKLALCFSAAELGVFPKSPQRNGVVHHRVRRRDGPCQHEPDVLWK
jgi:hypothetical protein